ncbi:hypothetical protein OZ002_02040 [Enterococcus sp. E4-150]|uniref:hypothetical protein n=1 Tax=Enterococcus sp. E4-150 TaxID=3002964 RepID=UPI002D800C8A|nr:hypothetical protein [Enterococcus sp. E4-150]MEB4785542.1 hypothetical protein [Enterococcus sp. E4-150]
MVYPEFTEEIKEVPENYNLQYSTEHHLEVVANNVAKELLSEIKLLRKELEEYRNENHAEKL